MATDKEFIVNKKFLKGFGIFVLTFVLIQIIVTALIYSALTSPKMVTVQVEKIDNSFSVSRPILNEPPTPSV